MYTCQDLSSQNIEFKHGKCVNRAKQVEYTYTQSKVKSHACTDKIVIALYRLRAQYICEQSKNNKTYTYIKPQLHVCTSKKFVIIPH